MVREYVTGVEAYKVWAEELQQHAWYDEHDDEALFHRLSVNQFCALALCDARKSAALYLASSKRLLPEYAEELEQIASCFDEVSILADSIQDMGGLEGSVETSDVRSFWTKQKRETQSETLLKMRELELKAIQIAAQVCAGRELAGL